MSISYKDNLVKLVEHTGGKVEDNLFVVEPGCIVINKTEPTHEGNKIFTNFDINNQMDYENVGELNARLCYLSFNKLNNKGRQSNINDRLIDLGHLSIYNDIHVTFLIAGISDEILKEFTAHNEAKVSRLTSSKTKAMTNTLYRLMGNKEEQEIQKKYIYKFLELRDQYLKETGKKGCNVEYKNMFNLGTKCTAFTFSMSIKDYHKLFIGRMGERGNESDVRLMCAKMCNILQKLYPKVIKDVDYYLGSSNSDKYRL